MKFLISKLKIQVAKYLSIILTGYFPSKPYRSLKEIYGESCYPVWGHSPYSLVKGCINEIHASNFCRRDTLAKRLNHYYIHGVWFTRHDIQQEQLILIMKIEKFLTEAERQLYPYGENNK